jgi:hypothetical protein
MYTLYRTPFGQTKEVRGKIVLLNSSSVMPPITFANGTIQSGSHVISSTVQMGAGSAVGTQEIGDGVYKTWLGGTLPPNAILSPGIDSMPVTGTNAQAVTAGTYTQEFVLLGSGSNPFSPNSVSGSYIQWINSNGTVPITPSIPLVVFFGAAITENKNAGN